MNTISRLVLSAFFAGSVLAIAQPSFADKVTHNVDMSALQAACARAKDCNGGPDGGGGFTGCTTKVCFSCDKAGICVQYPQRQTPGKFVKSSIGLPHRIGGITTSHNLGQNLGAGVPQFVLMHKSIN